MCKCCLPGSGAKPPAHSKKQESIRCPSNPSVLPFQQLYDIEEEEDRQTEQLELLDQEISSTLRKRTHRRQFTSVFNRSTSPTFSVTTPLKSTKNKDRTRSVNSGGIFSKMQPEQGSISDLKLYHNRYLRNRRHTLANVR